MNPKVMCCSVLLVAGITLPSRLFAQSPPLEFPAPSPACTVKQRVGLTDIEIVYSRPGVKNRKIFGGLVPYGQVWRTGANQATKLTLSGPVKLNGADIPAGSYELFTIPGEKEWTIIINKAAKQWGAYQYNEKDDLVRVKATPVQLAESVETFTIDFNDIRDQSATLYLLWDKTYVPIKIEMNVVDTLVPKIKETMAAPGDRKPYFQAAMFYYDHNLDLKQAREWIDAAVKQRDAFYVAHLQAKILAKLGDKEAAIAAAKRSIELAKKANDTSYQKLNQDLINSLQ